MMSQTSENNNHDTASRKIFVGSLAWQTTTEDLRRFFEQFGEVIDANVVCETYPGRSKGYGFVSAFFNSVTYELFVVYNKLQLLINSIQ